MKKLFWLLAICCWFFPCNGFSHQDGIDCKDKNCRTMLLLPTSFTSDGKRIGGLYWLSEKKETYAKWKFVVPKGFPPDANVSLGMPSGKVNLSCKVKEGGVSASTWPSPYAPVLSISSYNPRTNISSPPVSNTIELMDAGTGRNKAITSINYFISLFEEDMEIEIALKRPADEERAPDIGLDKNSCWITYIFKKEGEKQVFPDRYEPNDTPGSVTVIRDLVIPASIWDGFIAKPVDVDWYLFTMDSYGRFEIEVEVRDEEKKPILSPQIKLYDEKLRLLSQLKGIRVARIGWSGKGKFFIMVSDSQGREGPEGFRYTLRIKK
ncbi:TPA: hypothetical protein DCX16_02580 [bacterium]|nr:hypothetical protein [bacterium]